LWDACSNTTSYARKCGVRTGSTGASAPYRADRDRACRCLRAARAIRALRAKDAQIDAFLKRGGLPGGAISKPPIRVEQVFFSVPTGLKKPAFRRVPAWHVTQGYAIETARIDTLVQTASRVGDLLAAGTDVAVSPIQYLSTKLTSAKFAALRLAVADARRRASTIAKGLSAKLGPVQKTALGVYQITPRNSTEVSEIQRRASRATATSIRNPSGSRKNIA
jgi:hypothetical protein